MVLPWNNWGFTMKEIPSQIKISAIEIGVNFRCEQGLAPTYDHLNAGKWISGFMGTVFSDKGIG